MRLPVAANDYDRQNEQQTRFQVEQEDARNLKRDEDLKLTQGAVMYVRDPASGAYLPVTFAAATAAAIVNNITALRARTWSPATPSTVGVVSNWVTGDGGGLFRLDPSDTTTADDGGIVIVDAAGNRWKRQFPGAVVWVNWWQPTGGFQRDITTALQAAVTYCETRGNGTIMIPQPVTSRWDLSGAIVINGAFSITIQGDGTVQLFQTAAANAFTIGQAGVLRGGWINLRDLLIWTDGTGLIGIRGNWCTNLTITGCDLYKWNTGGIYLSDCYTFVISDTGIVDDTVSPTSDYGLKIDGASGNAARFEGGHMIGFINTGAVALNVTGQHFGFHVVHCDFEYNRRDVEIFADGTGAAESLYLHGIYSEDPTGAGKPFLYVDNAIATTPKNISVRNCNLLNTHITLYKCDGFTEDSNFYHGSAAGATVANEVLYIGPSVTNWRFGNSRYGGLAFATAPHPGEWQRFPTWSTYTPTWTAATTNPTIGNGTLLGRYKRDGNTVTVQIRLVPGTTTTYGVGRWAFSLPFNVISSPTLEWIGTDTSVFDSAVGAKAGAVASYIVSSVADRTRPVVAANFNNVDASNPHVWKSGDNLNMIFTYECA